MPNFILIGMPASGKSTLGKMAAAALQYNFAFQFNKAINSELVNEVH